MARPVQSLSEALWTPIQNCYHLSTIGIGEVFLGPTNPLQAESLDEGSHQYADDESSSDYIIQDTNEIVGSLKLYPEDFIVHEIGGLPPSFYRSHRDKKDSSTAVITPKIATLSSTTTPDKNNASNDSIPNMFEHFLPHHDENKGATLEHVLAMADFNDQDSCFTHPDVEVEEDDMALKCDVSHHHQVVVEDPAKTSVMGGLEHDLAAKSKVLVATSIEDTIQLLLTHCVTYCNSATRHLDGRCDEEMKQGWSHDIKSLYEEALADIDHFATNENYSIHDRHIYIPPFHNHVTIEYRDGSTEFPDNTSHGAGGNRGLFHRMCASAFPLLRTTTLSEDESRSLVLQGFQQLLDENGDDSKFARWIVISKDTTFHSIISYLSHPKEDLCRLYSFRKMGFAKFSSDERSMVKTYNSARNRHESKTRHMIEASGDELNCKTSLSNNQVMLRLKHNLSKDMRQLIHKIIQSSCRDFETATESTPLTSHSRSHGSSDSKDFSSNGQERIILVCWSRQAIRNANGKRKLDNKRITNSLQSTCGSVVDSSHVDKSQSMCNTLCVLRKRNVEHAAAIYLLASALKCKPSSINFAGIKDKCAVTYQFCTLRYMEPSRLILANRELDDKGISIGNCERVNWILTNGSLIGNQFQITIRNIKRIQRRTWLSKERVDSDGIEEKLVPCSSQHIELMVNRLKKFGFVNYYGEQRVGAAGAFETVGIRSIDIGRAMLQGDLGKAIDLIMQGRAAIDRNGEYVEGADARNIRRVWKESGGCPATTLDAFPKGMNILPRERIILQGLKRYGKNEYLKALRCLQHSLRMFWIHAYQSHIFNTMVTERIVRLGTSPQEGDLILVDSQGRNTVGAVDDPNMVSFHQIVLPLPGYGVEYPKNEIGRLYKETLQRDGIIFDKKSAPEVTARGSYRKVVAMPGNVEWCPLEDECNSMESNYISTAEFKFSLEPGSYATMFLREMMVTKVARQFSGPK